MTVKSLSLSHFVCIGPGSKKTNTACPGASPRMVLGIPPGRTPADQLLPVPLVAPAPSFWMGAHRAWESIKGQVKGTQVQDSQCQDWVTRFSWPGRWRSPLMDKAQQGQAGPLSESQVAYPFSPGALGLTSQKPCCCG